MVARGSVAHEGAVDGSRSGEDLAGRKIGPVARTDEPAGLDPIEAAIEMGGELGARFSFYSKRFRSQHAFAEFVAESINETVVGAHALLHNFGRNANHVRVANLAALNDFDYSHARAKFTGLWGHTQDADVGGFESVQYGRRSRFDGAWAKVHGNNSSAGARRDYRGTCCIGAKRSPYKDLAST